MIHCFTTSSLPLLSDQKKGHEKSNNLLLSLHLRHHFFFVPDVFSPLGHSQWKELILSTHLPLLRQGWLAHSSVLMLQNTPSYPERYRVISQIISSFLFLHLIIVQNYSKNVSISSSSVSNKCSYLAYRCSGTLRSGPGRWRHYGKDSTCIH